MKTIIVPLNLEAMNRLDFNCNIIGDLMELNITTKQLYKLFENGFFPEINKKLNVIIDDYEDEKILGFDNLKLLESIVINYFLKFNDEIYLQIHTLILIALEKNTGIFFFF